MSHCDFVSILNDTWGEGSLALNRQIFRDWVKERGHTLDCLVEHRAVRERASEKRVNKRDRQRQRAAVDFWTEGGDGGDGEGVGTMIARDLPYRGSDHGFGVG